MRPCICPKKGTPSPDWWISAQRRLHRMDLATQNEIRERPMQFVCQGVLPRRFIALLLFAWHGATMAFVEANTAPPADLSSIRGIGPATAQRIVQAREAKPFLHWQDLISRVRGIGTKRAQQLSQGGLRVRGRAYGDQQQWHTITPRKQPPRRPRKLVDPFRPSGEIANSHAE